MILVTGGLGYLGSHIALYLMSKGLEVVLVDNLSHSSMENLERLEYITKMFVPFVRVDVRNTPALQKVFEQYPIDYVIHCAGFKSLPESTIKPLDYYNNNLTALMSILRAMQRGATRRIVNLSSATVYGRSAVNLAESDPFEYHNQTPYIRAQQTIEGILQDTFTVDQFWQMTNLRLSNVAGAYNQGEYGEWTSLLPKSLLPLLLQVAAGQRESFEIFNQDLDTEDGTAERDFIHVMDVAEAVLQLMQWSNTQQNGFAQSFNIATGKQTSVQAMIDTVEKVTGQSISVIKHMDQFSDLPRIGLNVDKVHSTIGWAAKFGLEDIIQDQWRYYQKVLAK